MNTTILNTDVQAFITKNLTVDTASILLKKSIFKTVTNAAVVEQIEAKKKCKTKLPTWFNTINIYYPNKLNIEQTSSEITAKYKSNLVNGKQLIDITGGFGVDSFYFSKVFNQVVYCEQNEHLSQLVEHNFKQLKATNITTKVGNGLSILQTYKPNYFDCIYIDPSRRHNAKGKVFLLEDTQPNVVEQLDLLFTYSKTLLIKTSPLLDITNGLKALKYVKTIYVVALNNEVKELLWLLKKDFKKTTTINTINIKKDAEETFNFKITNTPIDATYSKPLTYLYQPNAAILKSGAFNLVSKQFNISKLHKHTHLYTSNLLINFPGKIFNIESCIAYNKKTFETLKIKQANIICKNFPLSTKAIKKQFKLKDGGNIHLFFTTIFNTEKVIIVATKV